MEKDSRTSLNGSNVLKRLINKTVKTGEKSHDYSENWKEKSYSRADMMKSAPSGEDSEKKTSEPNAKLNFTKIAPKPLTTGKNSQPGQVIILQGSSTNNSIRLPNKNTGAKPMTIQLLKMHDGSLVPLKNNKSLNLTNLSNVTQVNIGSKKVVQASNSNSDVVNVKSTSSSQVVLTPSPKLTAAGNTTGTTVLKSLTMAEAQKAGFLKLKPIESGIKQAQKLVAGSQLNLSSTTVTTSGTKTTRVILPDTKGVIMKTENETGSKQIMVPKHLLKLSPTSKTPIQAIQIPGKSGVQYVRVLGTTSSTAGSNSKNSSLPIIKPKDASPTKITVVPSSSGLSNQKIVMTSKSKQLITQGSDTKLPSNFIQSGNRNSIKPMITTVPTLRKIQATNTQLVVVKKEEESGILGHTTKIKLEPTGLKISLHKSNIDQQQLNSTENSSTIVKQEICRENQHDSDNSKANDSDSEIMRGEKMIPKKLYSVLKPSSESLDDSLPSSKKRSPSPEALRRKHCNCTKSQCLKLYCDCFANGEFCQDCNCKECYNNLDFEDERQKAIRNCLERNPNAFKPKITKARDQSDLRLHNKGCNCKRSGCLKNYCECYEAKITCSSNCKCFGCRNIEERTEMDAFEVAKIAQNFGRGLTTKRSFDEVSGNQDRTSQPPPKQSYNFITQDVVDATIQCMIAQADECRKGGLSYHETEKMILEELGRSLIEIIDFSIRNMDN